MIKTFNCGVGFCNSSKKILKKLKKYFPRQYKPYEIGFISKGKNRTNLLNNLRW